MAVTESEQPLAFSDHALGKPLLVVRRLRQFGHAAKALGKFEIARADARFDRFGRRGLVLGRAAQTVFQGNCQGTLP